MTCNILATGSGGNAVVINESILVDCGVPFKTLEAYIKPLKLVLLTHGHGDHFKPSTAARLYYERPALRWGCCPWMVPRLLEAGVDKRAIDVYEPGQLNVYGKALSVTADLLVHDVPNCCYHIRLGGESLFYATDTGTLEGIEAPNCELYLIEANHTRAELEARIAQKEAAGIYPYEYAAARNHLSEEQALDWLAQNMGPGSRYIFLHQHKDR